MRTRTIYVGVVANETVVRNESLEYVKRTLQGYENGSRNIFKETITTEQLDINPRELDYKCI